jgi:hypothetical protein
MGFYLLREDRGDPLSLPGIHSAHRAEPTDIKLAGEAPGKFPGN